MNKMERGMYLAMQDSGWWPIGDEAIEDVSALAGRLLILTLIK